MGEGSFKSTKIKVDGGVVPTRYMKNRVITGGGISIDDEPKYQKFGKYIIHWGQLKNKNILNFKYPSEGRVVSLLPTQIGEDFKDFVVDTIETGRMNEKVFNTLKGPEKEYFLKAVRGAGLIDKFKIKNATNEDDKKDTDRFNVLKGEWDAGNNNDKLVKELKHLLIRFMGSGKVNKQLGTQLLIELNLGE